MLGYGVATSSYNAAYGAPLQYGGFWLRFAAYIIDTVIIAVPVFLVAFIFGIIIGITHANSGSNVNAFDASNPAMGCCIDIIAIVGAWLYWAMMESSNKMATLGKMAVGLKVTDMAGRKISFGQASGRFFGKIISGIIIYIGFMMAGWTEKKQALHDIMASTLVVRK
jgi:uncharacterized RDD family membrane protein YckC